jgi:tripartite-type tricarboxylate transporter receptor subunit TctC
MADDRAATERQAKMRRREFVMGTAAALMPLAAPALRAQERYPSRPIRLLIPSVPGGVHDVIGRVWAERIKQPLGTVVIDNRGGAGGAIASADAAMATPDGYTILLGSTTTHVLVPLTMARPPYDPVRDFATASIFANSSTSVVINPSVPAATLAEFIIYAKANPGKLSYGSAGNGSITNLAGEMFKQRAGGLDIVHIPYKGIGPIITDVLGGQLPMLMANATAQVLDLHRAGKLKILCINAQARLKSAPEIPTAAEAGLPGMVAQTFFGIFAPAATPKSVMAKLDEDTQKILSDTDFQKQLTSLGFEPMPGIGTDAADRFVKDEIARWLPIIRAAAAKPK